MSTFGPHNASLTVRTGRTGAAARAGHDLLIEVGSWSATLEPGDASGPGSLELSADSRSLRVLEGTGGIQPLGDSDKASIAEAIDDEVLKGSPIEFRSTDVRAGPGGRLTVQGELELGETRRPVTFELEITDGGRVTGGATLKQTDWGIKLYSTLFGTLKVADEVRVEIEATNPQSL